MLQRVVEVSCSNGGRLKVLADLGPDGRPVVVESPSGWSGWYQPAENRACGAAVTVSRCRPRARADSPTGSGSWSTSSPSDCRRITSSRTSSTSRRAVEATVFDTLWLPDHLVQGPVGDIDDDRSPQTPIFDAPTLLAALGGVHRARAHRSAGQPHHDPPSRGAREEHHDDRRRVGGRAVLGIGAAWDADEHRRYGLEFPAPGERVSRLADAVPFCQGAVRPRGRHLHGNALLRRRGVQRAPPGEPDPHRRRRRRQADVAHRRPPRRRLQPDRHDRRAARRVRALRSPLRRRRP